MQADRWKQVEKLFEAALAQPAERRAAFLEQACPDDPELRREVESLLNLVPSAASFLEGAPISSMHEHSLVLTRGQKLGNFEILEPIGRGGMGEVYGAKDARLDRVVAIKVLVAVGTIIAGRPPHRSVQALLRIRLPPWVTGVKALHRVRMENARYWNPSVYDPVKPFHGDPAALAAPR